MTDDLRECSQILEQWMILVDQANVENNKTELFKKKKKKKKKKSGRVLWR